MFKVGDRVVLITDAYSGAYGIGAGECLTITLLDWDPVHIWAKTYNERFKYKTNTRGACFQIRDLISEEIWGSPLYQALIEKD
jgi:hypothetical protein